MLRILLPCSSRHISVAYLDVDAVFSYLISRSLISPLLVASRADSPVYVARGQAYLTRVCHRDHLIPVVCMCGRASPRSITRAVGRARGATRLSHFLTCALVDRTRPRQTATHVARNNPVASMGRTQTRSVRGTGRRDAKQLTTERPAEIREK